MPPAAAAASQEKNASCAVWTTAPLATCAALLRLNAGACRGLAAVASFRVPKRATVAPFTTRIVLCGLAAFRAAGSCACIRSRGLPGSTSSPPRPHRSFRRKPRHTKIGCVEFQAADSNRPGCRRYAPHRGHFRRGLFNPGAFFGGVPHAARADRCGCAPPKPPGLVLAGGTRKMRGPRIRTKPKTKRLLWVCAKSFAFLHKPRAVIIPRRHPGKDTSPRNRGDPPCLGPRRRSEYFARAVETATLLKHQTQSPLKSAIAREAALSTGNSGPSEYGSSWLSVY